MQSRTWKTTTNNPNKSENYEIFPLFFAVGLSLLGRRRIKVLQRDVEGHDNSKMFSLRLDLLCSAQYRENQKKKV